MTEKNKIFLLKVVLVVVALALGYSLNMLSFRLPFVSPAPEQVTSQKKGSGQQDPQLEPPASKQKEQASLTAPEGKRDSSDATGGQCSGDQKPEQTPADSQVSSAPSAALPASSDAVASKESVKESQPAESGLSGQADKDSQASSAADAAKQAAVYVKTETGSEGSADAPKVLNDEKAARAAKIGRQVPADAQVAKNAEAPGKDDSKQTLTAKTEKKATRAEGDHPALAVTEAKKEKPGKPERNTSGVKENALPEASDRQTASVSETLPKQTEKTSAAKGGRVVDVTTQDNPGEFVLTITTDGPVDRVTSFYAKDPARLAVDIWGGWQSSVPGVIAVGGPLMERIRIGSHPDKLRLVVDYRDKESSGFLEPVVEKKDKGVVVRVPKSKKPE